MTRVIRPAHSALISLKTFMASMRQTTELGFTASPTLMKFGEFGSGLLWLEQSVDENHDEQSDRTLYVEPI